MTFALFLNSAAARSVLGIPSSGGFWRLKLPEGITDLLLHSSSLPLLTVIFCSKKEKQGRKREAWPYGMWNRNLPRQAPRHIQMMGGGGKIPIPRSLVAAGYCFVKKKKKRDKGAWHNRACKCVWWSWWSWLRSGGEEGQDRLYHFFFLRITFLAVNLMCKKISLNYHHFWD